MKTIKFREKLAKEIINGKRTSTWRLFDDKNISIGDKVFLIVWETGKEFAKAIITDIKEIPFGELKQRDWKSHGFSSKDEMLKTYSLYYGREINENNKIKVIKFRLEK